MELVTGLKVEGSGLEFTETMEIAIWFYETLYAGVYDSGFFRDTLPWRYRVRGFDAVGVRGESAEGPARREFRKITLLVMHGLCFCVGRRERLAQTESSRPCSVRCGAVQQT